MKIMCLDNLEKTFYTTEIYDDMFYDTVEAFKVAGIEVIEYNPIESLRLFSKGYRKVK